MLLHIVYIIFEVAVVVVGIVLLTKTFRLAAMNGQAIGPVLTFGFLVCLDHSEVATIHLPIS